MIDFTKWSNDTNCQKILKSDYQNYISQFTTEEADLLDTLLLRFDFYDNEKCLINFHNYDSFLEKLVFEYKDIVFFFPFKDCNQHNSFKMIPYLKKISKEYNCVYKNYHEKMGDKFMFATTETIVVIDDFSGSGKSIVNMLTDINSKLEIKKNIIVAPMLITDYAIENIKCALPKLDKINISFSFANKIRQAKLITKHSLLNQEQIKLYEEICYDANVKNKYGFDDTEELIAFSYFTPNNTLGLLWQSSGYILPFLKRNDNNFTYPSKEFYFSKEYLRILKSSIKNIKKNKNKLILSLLLLLYISPERIISCLKIESKKQYDDMLEECIKSKIITKSMGKYGKGLNFEEYIDDEIFTRLKCLNQDYSRKKKIDMNFEKALT